MADQPTYEAPASQPQKGAYGKKRPWWYWLVIYLVVGGALYFAIWYFFLQGSGGYQLY